MKYISNIDQMHLEFSPWYYSNAVKNKYSAHILETRIKNISIARSNSTGTPESKQRVKRAATARPERVWDYAVIPYEIDANFSGVHKALFKQECID